MSVLNLTVGDVLSRDSFKYANVVAGKDGLGRQVKWSHVLEAKEFDTLINGGEMILTTGVGLQLDVSSQLKYITRLIEKDVACICVELGPYFELIPPEIIELADKYAFPFIVFEKTVKFVDITQDLHTFIINQHHQMLSQLDILSRKFITLSLAPNGILKILQELNQFFRHNILFITDEAKPYYYPSEAKVLETSIRKHLENYPFINTEQKFFTLDGQIFAAMPVMGLGQVWGHLCLQVNEQPSDDFPFLILDRAALAITQVLLRNRTIEERKQKNEDEFVRNLLNGRAFEQDDLQVYLPTASRNMYFRVFIIQMNVEKKNYDMENWEEVKLQRSMMVRSLFKRHGFFPAVSSRKNEITIIASFIAADHLRQETKRFTQIVDNIIGTKDIDFIEWKECKFGISKVYKEISDIARSYEEANEVLELKEAIILNSNFHEDIGVYQVLLPLKKSGNLETYIQDYLGPVLDYDERMQSDLLETLSIYLEHRGSKKEAAERLYIVRQTLYHRIEKLQSLLGDDFMVPANRIAIEIAIKAYELLKGMNHKEKKSDIVP